MPRNRGKDFLSRTTKAADEVSKTAYTYNGNQLTKVEDATGNAAGFSNGANAANEYTYDNNGNLTKDSNKNISTIAYNCLNLPSKVTFCDGSTIVYSYAADGTKLRMVHTISGTTTQKDYCGNVIYENGVQKMLLTEEGYVDLSNSTYYYYLKDHQGNNRVVLSSGGTVAEVNHYYPFGGVFASASDVQPYKYNGKELDTKKGLNWYDYGARHYDAFLGRFMTQDRFAEKYSALSPYQYGANNPVCNVDVNGDSIFVNPNPAGIMDYVKMLFGLKTDFQVKVYNDIEQLKKEDKVVADMIESLGKSANKHIITVEDSKKGNYVAPDKPNELMSPQGSTIGYNPDKWSNGIDKRPPRAGLAHELSHSYELDKGLYKDLMFYGVPDTEINAIIIENRIRKVNEYPKRSSYNGKKIPEHMLLDD